MSTLISLSNALNSLPLANIAGVLWVSWLIAITIMLCYARDRFYVPHRKWLIAAAITFVLWRALLTISAGEHPIIERSDMAGLIRLLDVITVVLLWIWLIITLKKRVVIDDPSAENSPSI